MTRNGLSYSSNRLESLRGMNVKIYRGGPESKEGVLLLVKSDFLALYVKDTKEVVYYNMDHIKSVVRNAKSNSFPAIQNKDIEVDLLEAADFENLLDMLKGRNVQIDRGGPESKKGLFVDVSSDCVVMLTKDDGIVYYNIQHIKSVSIHKTNEENESNQMIPDHIHCNDFDDVFENLLYQWVSINRGGPESIEGVLVEGKGEYYALVSNEELVLISPCHIKSISKGPKGALKQNKNNNQEEENECNENESKTSGSRSCRSRSESRSRLESRSDSRSRSESRSKLDSRSRTERFPREVVVKEINYRYKSN